MVEPIAVAVSPRGEFVVVDNGVGILVFDQCGKLIRNCHKSQSNDGKNLLWLFGLKRSVSERRRARVRAKAGDVSWQSAEWPFTFTMGFVTVWSDQENCQESRRSREWRGEGPVQGHHGCVRHPGGEARDRSGGHQDSRVRPRHRQLQAGVRLEDTQGRLPGPLPGVRDQSCHNDQDDNECHIV